MHFLSQQNTKSKLQEDTLFLLPTLTNIKPQMEIYTLSCCLTLAQLFTDIMFGNTFSTSESHKNRFVAHNDLNIESGPDKNPALTEKLSQQPTKQRGRVRMMIMTEGENKMIKKS